MANDDLPVRQTQRPRRPHVVELAITQEFGPNIVRQPEPAKQAQQHQQQRDARGKHRAENNQQIQLGHRAPDFHEALESQVRLAAEITLNRPGDDAQHGASGRQRQRKQHADAKAVNQLGQQVAAAVIRAEQVGHRGARRIRFFGKVVQCFGAVGVGCKNSPVVAFGELVADEGVEVISGCFKITAKNFLRVGLQHREVETALVLHDQRTVV